MTERDPSKSRNTSTKTIPCYSHTVVRVLFREFSELGSYLVLGTQPVIPESRMDFATVAEFRHICENRNPKVLIQVMKGKSSTEGDDDQVAGMVQRDISCCLCRTMICVDDFSIVCLDKITWSLVAGKLVSSAVDVLIAIGYGGELCEELEVIEQLR